MISNSQFCISMQFSSIWPIDRTLSDTTTPGQSGPGSDGNKGVLCISQSSSIAGALPSDCLVSYLVYSTVPAEWANKIKEIMDYNFLILGVSQLLKQSGGL